MVENLLEPQCNELLSLGIKKIPKLNLNIDEHLNYDEAIKFIKDQKESFFEKIRIASI